jgi:hypothetical protein
MLAEDRRTHSGLGPGLQSYIEPPGMESITIQLAPGEVLALYSFLALGAHFAAVVSGENSPFSLSEISDHITTLGEMTPNTLTDKLAGAVAAAQEREPANKNLS